MNNPLPGPAHGKSNANYCYTGSSTSRSHCHQPQHFVPLLSHLSFPLHPQGSCSQSLLVFFPGFPKFLSNFLYPHHCEILGSRHNNLKLLPTLKVTKHQMLQQTFSHDLDLKKQKQKETLYSSIFSPSSSPLLTQNLLTYIIPFTRKLHGCH